MIYLESATDLLKEISVPVFIVNAPEALVVIALTRTISRKGPELLILQEKRRMFSLYFHTCWSWYESTLATSFQWGAWWTMALQDAAKHSGLGWLKGEGISIKIPGFSIVDLKKRPLLEAMNFSRCFWAFQMQRCVLFPELTSSQGYCRSWRD